jgi:peptidoglycan/LPS O-acetylase OafA/YrhL
VEGDLVNDIFSVGSVGVAFFFVVSGFILSLPFARQYLCGGKPVSLREYYIRRVTRIEPPYVIHLIILLVLCVLVLRHFPGQVELYGNPHWLAFSTKHILASLIYSNGFIYGQHPFPNIVLWSLEIEVQFYILAPLLARIFTLGAAWKRRSSLVCLIFLLQAAIQSVDSLLDRPYRLPVSLAGNLQYFFAGFLLADLYLTSRLTVKARTWKWDFLFVAAASAMVCFRHSPWFAYVTPGVIFICCAAAFRGAAVFRILGNPWVTTIGGMCYTIYMYHALMISTLIRLTIHIQMHVLWLDLLIQFFVMSAAIICMSAILFALFERPFMRKNWPPALWSALCRRSATAAKG